MMLQQQRTGSMMLRMHQLPSKILEAMQTGPVPGPVLGLIYTVIILIFIPRSTSYGNVIANAVLPCTLSLFPFGFDKIV
ncbi:hypothetical protein BDW75DRAFT_221285, partial [Aspergillus navahoensis]